MPVSDIDITITQFLSALQVPGLNHLPNFLLRRLEQLLHLRQINHCLNRFSNLTNGDFIHAVLDYLKVDLHVHGAHEFDTLERPVLISNHPLGILDALTLMGFLVRHFSKVRVLANSLLMWIPQIQDLLIPVNKFGTNRQYWRQYCELFESDVAILHFPAGLCSRRSGGRLLDLPWHHSYVRLCRDNARPILSCFFAGENSTHFYMVANLRRWFHISFNIEMMFLVDEMFRQQETTLDAWIGKTILPSQLSGNVHVLNREIHRQVYSLRQ